MRRRPSLEVVVRRVEKALALGTLFTTSEAARSIDRNAATVRAWRTRGLPDGQPSLVLWLNRSQIPLYTEGDVERLRSLRDRMRPGPLKGTTYRPRQHP